MAAAPQQCPSRRLSFLQEEGWQWIGNRGDTNFTSQGASSHELSDCYRATSDGITGGLQSTCTENLHTKQGAGGISSSRPASQDITDFLIPAGLSVHAASPQYRRESSAKPWSRSALQDSQLLINDSRDQNTKLPDRQSAENARLACETARRSLYNAAGSLQRFNNTETIGDSASHDQLDHTSSIQPTYSGFYPHFWSYSPENYSSKGEDSAESSCCQDFGPVRGSAVKPGGAAGISGSRLPQSSFPRQIGLQFRPAFPEAQYRLHNQQCIRKQTWQYITSPASSSSSNWDNHQSVLDLARGSVRATIDRQSWASESNMAVPARRNHNMPAVAHVQDPTGETLAVGFDERAAQPVLPPAGLPDAPAQADPVLLDASESDHIPAGHTPDRPVVTGQAVEQSTAPDPNGNVKWRLSTMAHFYLLRVVCFLTACTGAAYLGWKTTMVGWHITNAGPACILFLITELLVFVCSFMLMLEVSVPARQRPALTMPEEGPFPLVSIFICCCKEPLDVIQDTVRGAMVQRYPRDKYTVWVLDDGGDDSLKEWVESEGMEEGGRLKYVRRPKPKGLPHHFKAGNINWGLRQAGGDFVVILDADMIPSSYFLTRMLPHFTSQDIAFVQCPQAFYNIVKGDPLNDSSQDFYDVFLPYRDGRDSAQCVGTGVVMRREVLRENGGFTTGSITEDFDTAMSFHARGYKTVYINQRLQAGLAPWTLEGYIKQHQRWATGSLQILFHRNPLLIRDRRFSLYRRVSYCYAGVQYYMNVVVLMVLVLPVIVLALDLRIMVRGDVDTMQRLYIILLVPYVTSSRLLCMALFSRLPNGFLVQLRGEQVWYWMAPFNCVAILRFFFPTKTFASTGSRPRAVGLLNRLSTVWFHLLYCAAGLGVVAWKLATVDFHDCGKLLKVTSWAPFIIFGCQNMAVPILFQLNANNHPKASERRSMLTYDEREIPHVRPEQLQPPRDAKLFLFFLVPAIWLVGIFFYFYVAITNFRPSFCTASGFFDYQQF